MNSSGVSPLRSSEGGGESSNSIPLIRWRSLHRAGSLGSCCVHTLSEEELKAEISNIKSALDELKKNASKMNFFEQQYSIEKLQFHVTCVIDRTAPEDIKKVQGQFDKIILSMNEFVRVEPEIPESFQGLLTSIDEKIKDLKDQQEKIKDEKFKFHIHPEKTRHRRVAELQSQIDNLSARKKSLSRMMLSRENCLDRSKQVWSMRRNHNEALMLPEQELKEAENEVSKIKKRAEALTRRAHSLRLELMHLDAELTSQVNSLPFGLPAKLIPPSSGKSMIPENVEPLKAAYIAGGCENKFIDPSNQFDKRVIVANCAESVPLQALQDIDRQAFQINGGAPKDYKTLDALVASLQNNGLSDRAIGNALNFCSQTFASDLGILAAEQFSTPPYLPNAGSPSYNIITDGSEVTAIEIYTTYVVGKMTVTPEGGPAIADPFITYGAARIVFSQNDDGTRDYKKGDELVLLWPENDPSKFYPSLALCDDTAFINLTQKDKDNFFDHYSTVEKVLPENPDGKTIQMFFYRLASDTWPNRRIAVVAKLYKELTPAQKHRLFVQLSLSGSAADRLLQKIQMDNLTQEYNEFLLNNSDAFRAFCETEAPLEQVYEGNEDADRVKQESEERVLSYMSDGQEDSLWKKWPNLSASEKNLLFNSLLHCDFPLYQEFWKEFQLLQSMKDEFSRYVVENPQRFRDFSLLISSSLEIPDSIPQSPPSQMEVQMIPYNNYGVRIPLDENGDFSLSSEALVRGEKCSVTINGHASGDATAYVCDIEGTKIQKKAVYKEGKLYPIEKAYIYEEGSNDLTLQYVDRSDNHDVAAIAPRTGYLAMADGSGMGGNPTRAADTAVQFAAKYYDTYAPPEMTVQKSLELQLEAIRHAQRALRPYRNPHNNTHQTTFSSAAIHGNLLAGIAVGDAPLFVLRKNANDEWSCISLSGSRAGEGVQVTGGHLAAYDEGGGPQIHAIRPFALELHEDDIVILASDGLSDGLDNETPLNAKNKGENAPELIAKLLNERENHRDLKAEQISHILQEELYRRTEEQNKAELHEFLDGEMISGKADNAAMIFYTHKRL